MSYSLEVLSSRLLLLYLVFAKIPVLQYWLFDEPQDLEERY